MHLFEFLTFYQTDAVLAVGQPPRPIAAFDKATIAVGCGGARMKY